MFGNPCFLNFGPKTLKTEVFDPKTEVFDPKTENYFRTIFAKFLRVQKDRLFLKNFRTSKAELFQNSRKQKVQKNPSNAWPFQK